MNIYPGCLLRPRVNRERQTNRYPVCHLAYAKNTWVNLWQSPSSRGIKLAQLLCQESLSTWIAWIPNHGEVVLDRSQFYC
ncbi:MAG: hypothetical protein ACFBSG_03555 [Leptolyngbyaceae cyanobacterium]